MQIAIPVNINDATDYVLEFIFDNLLTLKSTKEAIKYPSEYTKK